MKSMKKRWGSSLVEVLTALGVLGVIIPTSVGAFGTVFAAEIRIHERTLKASYAEWWFNQLEFPVSQADLDAAPRAKGKTRFSWRTMLGAHDTLRITLSVSNGSSSDVPYTESRIY